MIQDHSAFQHMVTS